MGRWGMRLFEGDRDLDIALELNCTFGEDDKYLHLSCLVHQTDMLAPTEARYFYESEEYVDHLDNLLADARERLDANGTGDKFLAHWRAKESDPGGKYRFILSGALMMRAGAKIKESDFEHLRELVPQIHCNPGYALPIFDEGFRGPGRVQFIRALVQYKDGTPRNYQEPSCFNCGKVKADSGKAPSKCGQCKGAWYCDQDCKKGHWKAHKPSCKDPKTRVMLNV
ncbi:Uu.00g064140.m01.CDS01 [Anthostomella pinea]|uniref:Uu.00g064140.m01.CDS01 n=1 Tax=Anthostomella pinea TaxID=933095 RepID=A0AAI8YMY6_9PEZI|nr:Uu.00g064140.m01.CDS01 [Anthostomella pinea]